MKRFLSPALFLLLVLTFPTTTYSAPQTTTLEPGKTIEQTIAGGEIHSYVVALGPGTYSLIELEQKGINVAVVIVAAGGQKLRTADLTGAGQSEQLSLLVEAATNYRVEVHAQAKANRLGSYVIRLKDTRPSTDPDKTRIEAEKLSEDAMQLVYQNTAASRGEAIAKFQQSLPLWQAIKDQVLEARTLYLTVYTLNVNGDYQKALDTAEQGLRVARATGNRAMEAYLLDEIGTSYNNRGERSKALEYFEQALPPWWD